MTSTQPRLNAFEKLAEVFRKTYLEMEVGESVEIGRLAPLDVDYKALIEEGRIFNRRCSILLLDRALLNRSEPSADFMILARCVQCRL